MITHRIVVNQPGLLITETDFVEDTPQQKYENNFDRIFKGDKTMPRSDKGTLRELTQIAENIRKGQRNIQQHVIAAKEKLDAGEDTIRVFAELSQSIKDTMNQLEEDVRGFDQRDRLESDPSVKG